MGQEDTVFLNRLRQGGRTFWERRGRDGLFEHKSVVLSQVYLEDVLMPYTQRDKRGRGGSSC